MKKNILTIITATITMSGFAQANFTDLNPDEVVNATYVGESYLVDLDGDATPEMTVFAMKQDTVLASVISTTITGVAIGTMGNTSVIGRIETLGTEDVLVADSLSTGDIINVDSSYVSVTAASIFPGIGLSVTESAFANVLGQFGGVGFKYVGVEFEISGTVHYGWVRLSVSAGSDVGTIDSYGYEATAGAPSVAGQQGTIFANVAENFDDLKVYTYDNNLYVKDAGNGVVEIFNVIGNKMKTINNSGNAVISMEGYPTGIYLVNYTKGGTTKTYKVIK